MANIHEHDYLACCGSSKFAAAMGIQGPFKSLSQAVDASRYIWWNQVPIPGWLEAFAAHPRIGDMTALKQIAATTEWSKGEQSTALKSADDSMLQELANWNQKYEAKFGFTFLICASGKSSAEILASLKERLENRPLEELHIAAVEQQKITEIRLGKLFATYDNDVSTEVANGLLIADRRVGYIGAHLSPQSGGASHLSENIPRPVQPNPPSSSQPPITTHVLDVSRGKPAAGVYVVLEMLKGSLNTDRHDSVEWVHIGSTTTDNDGRAGPLMAPSNVVSAGTYKLTFNTQKYFRESKGAPDYFYPYISLAFQIKPGQVQEHFHVPVLLSPFSYTTYRGS